MPTSPNNNTNLTNPFEAARRTLIAALSRMSVPRAIGSFASPADFEAIRDHIREAAAICDSWLGDIGHQVSDNAPCKLDLTPFDAAFSGAVDGNATWICEEAAQMLRDEHREVA